MTAAFESLETSGLAAFIANSQLTTAGLSAMHLVGFTLVMGSALVSNLRRLGMLFADRPLLEVIGPARRGLLLGLAVSLTTGFLLFSPRATAASRNDIFQMKMILLATAAFFHFVFQRWVAGDAAGGGVQRVSGAVALALWIGVAVAGCAYILLE